MKKLLLAGAALLCMCTTATASIIPVLETITPEGGLFRFSYEGTLSGDQGVTDGSRTVIFDFSGFAGGLTAPNPAILAYTELVTLGMLTPPAFTDDPTIPNLVFEWNGPDFRTSGGPYADINFDGLSALSIYNQTRLDGFTTMALTNNGVATGLRADNVGSVGVPNIPEPGTWAMMLIGFAGIGSALRSHRRRAVAFA